MPTPPDARWLLRVYRDDSLTPVVYEDVKHVFWTNTGTVLTVAQYKADGSHHYFNWPRERVAWYQLERVLTLPSSSQPPPSGRKGRHGR